MRKSANLLLAILFICLPLLKAYPQNENPDSLIHALKNLDNPSIELSTKASHFADTIRVNLLNKISRALSFSDPLKAKLYGEEALKIARSLKSMKNGYAKGMMNAYNNLSGIYNQFSQYDTSVLYVDSAIRVARISNNKKSLSQFLNNKGVIYFDQHLYRIANDFFLEAFQINEELSDSSALAKSFQLRANICSVTGNYNEAINLAKKSFAFHRSENNRRLMANNCYNIGNYYYNIDKEDSCIAYMDSASQLAMETGSMQLFTQISLRKGTIYGNKSDFTSAIRYFRTAFEVSNSMRNPKDIATSALALAEALIQKAKFENTTHDLGEAKNLIQNALQLSRQTGNIGNLAQSYLDLTKLDSLNGNWKSAYENFKSYQAVTDTLSMETQNEEIVKATLQYDYEKREEQLKFEQQLTKEKLERQKIISLAVGIGLAFIIVFVILLIRRIRENKKANAELKIAMAELHRTQDQLVQTEKMAAFGSLASRVAHEVLNPLNFVNNFSEIAKDLATEISESENPTEKKMLTNLLHGNLDKIIHHGQRAQGIIDTLQKHVDSGTAHEFFEKEKN